MAQTLEDSGLIKQEDGTIKKPLWTGGYTEIIKKD